MIFINKTYNIFNISTPMIQILSLTKGFIYSCDMFCFYMWTISEKLKRLYYVCIWLVVLLSLLEWKWISNRNFVLLAVLVDLCMITTLQGTTDMQSERIFGLLYRLHLQFEMTLFSFFVYRWCMISIWGVTVHIFLF